MTKDKSGEGLKERRPKGEGGKDSDWRKEGSLRFEVWRMNWQI